MDIELLGLVNVLADAFQDHHLHKPLKNSLLGGRKYPSGRVANNRKCQQRFPGLPKTGRSNHTRHWESRTRVV